MKSRKFQVWLAWFIYIIVALIITKSIDATITSWFGTVSIVYIGGNVAQKQIFKD